MESNSAALTVFERIQEALCAGFKRDQTEAARTEVLKWLQAWIQTYQDRSAEEQQRLVETSIPEYVQNQIKGLNKKQRFAFAVTAYDRWQLDTLNGRTLARAERFRDKVGDPQALKAEAERDLETLKAIETRLLKDFPDTYKQYQRVLSESKLDCLYVIRDGAIASRRLAL
jgi:hypothetical protein